MAASAPSLKEPPLLSTPSTTISRWSLLWSWVLIFKELRNLLPSFMFILSTTLPYLSIPDVPFTALLSRTLIRRRFQVKPATLLSPVNPFPFLLVEEFYSTRYQSGSFSLINVGSDFSLPALNLKSNTHPPTPTPTHTHGCSVCMCALPCLEKLYLELTAPILRFHTSASVSI